jgi:replicative DNA helicase
LISICIQSPEKIIDVIDSDIGVEHFAVLAHQHIFMAIMYLYSKKIQPTPLAIMEVLTTEQSKKAVEEIGGLDYLMTLNEINISVDNVKIFIEKVKQSYVRVSLSKIADQTMKFVLSDKAEVLNPKELIGYIESKIADINHKDTGKAGAYKMGDKTDEVLKQRSESPNQIPGLETGWTMFDRYTGGGRGGDLIAICAPSKTGKSVILTNWATKFGIIDKMPILYFDTEMNEREQEDRILANLSGVPHSEICSGLYVMDTAHGKSEDKIARIKEARDKLKMGNYYHIHIPQFSSDMVMAIAKKFVLQFGVRAIFFDYIKIPSSQAGQKNQQEYQQLGYLASSLKEMAGILDVPVYTACQTNRDDLENENPDASNIGGSYRILQLASKLIFLVNKSPMTIAKEGKFNGNQRLLIKYQRNGMSDCPPINVMFDKNILRQEEC